MVTMQCAIDRIEDGVAICIDDEGKVFDLPFYQFPEGTGEGSIVQCVFEGNELLSVKLLSEETSKKAAENEARVRSLFDKFRKTDKE